MRVEAQLLLCAIFFSIGAVLSAAINRGGCS